MFPDLNVATVAIVLAIALLAAGGGPWLAASSSSAAPRRPGRPGRR